MKDYELTVLIHPDFESDLEKRLIKFEVWLLLMAVKS